jgi:hypothetical protein
MDFTPKADIGSIGRNAANYGTAAVTAESP